MLSGGGARGAAQAGAISALIEAGIRPATLVGCSVGALNAAFVAGGADVARAQALEQRWLAVGRPDVFGGSRLSTVRNLVAGRAAVFSQEPLRRLIETWLPATTFEGLAVPLRVVTTVLATGQPAYHDRGPLDQILLASSALPGLFLPVPLPILGPGGGYGLNAGSDLSGGSEPVRGCGPGAGNGGYRGPERRRRGPTLPPGTELHVDGGISEIVPLRAAQAADPTDVWVLDVAAPPGTGYWRPHSALGVLGASVTASMRARPMSPWDGVRVHHLALRGERTGPTAMMDFSRSAELIELGREVARRAIAESAAGVLPAVLPSLV